MRYLARKIALYLFIAWSAITLNFLIPRLMPGDPIDLLTERIEGTLDPAALQSLREAYGLTETNLLLQYRDYLLALLRGDLGLSIGYYPVRVAQMVGDAMPWTIGLIGTTTVISFLIGTLLGVLLAWRRGSWTDHLLPLLTFLNAIPYFWLALILVLVFGVTLGWFEIAGGYDPAITPGWTAEFAGSVLYYATLPAITIVLA